MIKHHFLFSLRNLWKFRSTAFLQVAGFVVGLGALVPVVMVLYYHITFDHFHKQSERIIRLSTRITLPDSEAIYAATSKSLAPLLKEQMPDAEEIVRYRHSNVGVSFEGKELGQTFTIFADSAFFDVFSAEVQSGDLTHALHSPDGIVINQTTAQRFFGEDDPIGKTVSLDAPSGQLIAQVKAVIKDLPENVSVQYAMVAPYSHIENAMRDNIAALVPGHFTYMLLKNKLDEEALASQFERIINEHFPEGLRDVISLDAVPMEDVHYATGHQFDSGRKGSRLNNLALAVLSLFLLFVTIANFVNLSTALLIKRSKEFAIRRIMGEALRQQYIQLFFESASLLIVVMLIVNLITYFLLPELEAMLNITLRTGIFTGSNFYISTIFIALAIALISSLIPFWLVSRTISLTQSKGANKGSGSFLLRYGLLAVQLFVSVLFAIIAFGMDEQLRYIKTKQLGFAKEHVVTMSIADPQVNAKADAIKQVFLQQSFVEAATISITPITGDHVRAQFKLAADTSGARPMMNANYVDADFGQVYGVKLLAGRFFNRDFASDVGHAFILNRKATQQFGFESPEAAIDQAFAKVLSDSVNTGTIIGVVENYHFQSLYQELEPMIWQIVPTAHRNLLAVKLEDGDIADQTKKLSDLVAGMGIAQAIEFTSLTDALDIAYREDDRLSFFIRVSAGVIVFISLLGVLALAAFIVETRKKEMGIRKLLGADIGHIMSRIGSPFALVLIVGLAVGGPIAYYFLGHWLRSFAFHVETSWWYLPAAAVSIAFLMGASLLLHVRRAAATDPAKILREE